MSVISCACGCGREFEQADTGKGRRRIYFDKYCCRKAVYAAKKKRLSTRPKCSVPGCPRRVMEGNHFLCERHYTGEIEVGYYDNI